MLSCHRPFSAVALEVRYVLPLQWDESLASTTARLLGKHTAKARCVELEIVVVMSRYGFLTFFQRQKGVMRQSDMSAFRLHIR